MSLVTDILRGAHDLLLDGAKWTRGTIARDRAGHRVQANSSQAVSWCVHGAVLKTGKELGANDSTIRTAQLLLNTVSAQKFHHVADFINDSFGYERAMEVLSLAVKASDEADANEGFVQT